MSMEQLKADLKDTLAGVKSMDAATATSSDIVKHLKFTLYPTLEAIVDEMDEIDSCMSDLIDGAEDILQPETAKIFSGLVVGGQLLVAKLREISAADPKLVGACDEWLALAVKGAETLAEITLAPDEDDEGDDDEEDDEDDTDEEGAE